MFKKNVLDNIFKNFIFQKKFDFVRIFSCDFYLANLSISFPNLCFQNFGWKTQRETNYKFRIIRLIWLAERFSFSHALWLAKRSGALTHSPRKWITRNSLAPLFSTIYFLKIYFFFIISDICFEKNDITFRLILSQFFKSGVRNGTGGFL